MTRCSRPVQSTENPDSVTLILWYPDQKDPIRFYCLKNNLKNSQIDLILDSKKKLDYRIRIILIQIKHFEKLGPWD